MPTKSPTTADSSRPERKKSQNVRNRKLKRDEIDRAYAAALWYKNLQDTTNSCFLPLFFDTSFGKGTIPLPAAKKIVERHGTDKILFGSDCPWHAPKMDLDFLDLLELSESEKEAILHKNAEKILKLS